MGNEIPHPPAALKTTAFTLEAGKYTHRVHLAKYCGFPA